ncbi:MAG TPA: GAF domain-containing protein, partial [Methylomirabilota bacterium]|nr:GAF domain-containing protein [Methylomirabilota bacterium]
MHELSTCATEADIVQVLYHGLQPVFGYDVVLLHVLEREGWYHSVPVDSGVLQDLRRRPLSDSVFAPNYTAERAAVVSQMDPRLILQGTGPGVGRYVKFAIFVPVLHQGRLIGAVIYQSYRNRRVPPAEIHFLEEVHKRLGVLLANASLNELTRNQARRLEALNKIGRAIATSLDVASILSALRATLSELLPVDGLKMVSLLPEHSDRARLMHVPSDAVPTSRLIATRAAQLGPARQVIGSAQSVIHHEPESQLWVPMKEGGSVRGALGITSKQTYAYEESTAAFLELVADEVTLALGNARSYEAIQEQRRRLELVNSIGRRLASSLDRWS